MKVNQKRILVSCVLMLTIAIFFWTGSRYPQLNEKALLGTDNPSMGISFDVFRDIQFRDSWIVQVLSNTANWIETNKKGMTFGLFFGAILMVLFSLLKEHKSNNRWVNAVIGTLIGAPLGVCVNCAAPIAMGMKDAGAKTETAMATMVSSPTLNVIVLSMLFSLLPPYMVWFKLGSTIILLLLIIPFLSKYIKSRQGNTAAVKERKLPGFFKLPPANIQVDIVQDKSWFGAIKWTVKGFFIGLWYLIRTAVPLMLLAGFLGNVLITFLPLEGFIQLTEAATTFESVLLMTGLALLGTFLPVPMAFDVLITAILWAGGLPAKYSMTLLFTLGSFSIYSAFVVDRAFSRKLAFAMFAIVTFMGMTNGTLGHFLEKKLNLQYLFDHYQLLAESEKPDVFETPGSGTMMLSDGQLNELLSNRSDTGEVICSQDDFEIAGVPYKARQTNTDGWFTAIEGQEIGMDVPYQFSPLHSQDIFSNQRSMAAGDVHGDGYPDLLMASASSLFLYANMEGESFLRQTVTIPDSLKVLNGALIDFDNDGWLDIYFSTYRQGNYIKYSDQGRFDSDQLQRLPQTDDLVTSTSTSFGDINADGFIDMVMGNWSIGYLGAQKYSVPAARNFVLKNSGHRTFTMKELPAPAGETFSTLLSDFMGDEAQDLLVGNDFWMPDYFYLGNFEKGDFSLIERPRDLVEKTTETTMSVTTVDIDNDLEFEIYEAQTDQWNVEYRTLEIPKICGSVQDDEQRGYCEAVFRKHQSYLNTITHRKFEHCEEEDELDCIAFQLIRHKVRPDIPGKPEDYIGEDWEEFDFVNKFRLDERWRHEQYLEHAADAKRPGGILLRKNKKGKYMDESVKYGIKITGWAWNTKFADLDNDEWQDLFVTNGFLLKPAQESNMFYRNLEGKEFKDMTVPAGLLNHLPSGSNSYVDFDLDGDLDIVLATAVGPVYLYENNNHKGNSISFRFHDMKANHLGIGAKITIHYGDGRHQMKELVASGGFKSYDQPIVHFGLGSFQQVDRVVVKWSSGEENTFDLALASGALYTLTRKSNIQ